MTPLPPKVPLPSEALNALEVALDQSHGVKAKVEACADELALANDRVKERIAEGVTTLPATQALQRSVAVEQTVQACAEDLKQVTDTLAEGVDEAKEVAQALRHSRAALVASEAALAISVSAEQAASRRALHDPRTKLPNRTLFDDRLAQAIAGAERRGWLLAVMFLDLDRFKLINDSHGHATGDAVLVAVAERLVANARDEDTVCRNGGDEFLYLLINPPDRKTVARLASLVRAAVAQPIELGALRLKITPSIGIALYPEHGQHGDQLIARADEAMYRAKQLRSPHQFYALV